MIVYKTLFMLLKCIRKGKYCSPFFLFLKYSTVCCTVHRVYSIINTVQYMDAKQVNLCNLQPSS